MNNNEIKIREIKEKNIKFSWKTSTQERIRLDIPQDILNHWQRIVDLIAKIMDVPAALIMRVDPPEIEVLVSSETKEKPYKAGTRGDLAGLYCNTVLLTNRELYVKNASINPIWKDNPDAKKHQMIFYLGYPLSWPNGQLFGTICVLDRKEREIDKTYMNLMAKFKEEANAFLELVYKNALLAESLEESEKLRGLLKEKNKHLALLNRILTHDINNHITAISGYLDLISGGLNEKEDKDYGAFIKKIRQRIKAIDETIQKAVTLKTVHTEIKLREIELSEYIINNIVPNFSIKIVISGQGRVLANDLLLSVFQNLLNNSINHHATEVLINIKEMTDKATIVEITDNGVGVPKEKLGNLFEDEKEKENGNKGLGLRICKEIMQQYNGKIKHDIKYTDGAKFVLWFPPIKQVRNTEDN
ncbi:MAG: GAF domain-containing sensor histidine kinase [Candidatus Heimdallarchaeaceae archaeon]